MEMNKRTRLLTATALAAVGIFSAQCASAQDTTATTLTKVTNPEDIKVANPEEVTVTGTSVVANGLMKEQRAPQAVYAITPEAISQRIPAASPLQVISTVPGVNFGTSDAFGLAIRHFLSIRGLDQTEIGWLVEGVPAIDPQNYGPFIETFSDNENISDITIMAGNSRLQDPILNATGGEYIQSIRDPQSAFGSKFSGSIGSFDSRRLFGRIDTGDFGATGLFSAFISGSVTRANPEQGPGQNARDHVDFKIRGNWGGDSASTLFISYNNLSNARVPIPTLAQFNAAKAANNWDLISYLSTYPTGGSTNYYKQFVWGRKNIFASNINKVQLTDDLRLTITPYFRYTDIDPSTGGTTVNPNSAFNGNTKITPVFDPANLVGGLIYARNEQYLHEYQRGVSNVLEYDINDSNHFMAGIWYDSWDTRSAAYIEPMTPTGALTAGSVTSAGGISNALQSASKQLVTGTDYQIGYDISSFFVGDTQAFFDRRLQISAGVKYIDYHASGYNYLPGPQQGFQANFGKWLPRASFSFDVNDEIQAYGNIIKSYRMPQPIGTYVNTYNAGTGVLSQIGNPNAPAESSTGEQFGIRYNGLIHVDLNYFRNDIKDLQIGTNTVVNGTNTSTVLSGGGVKIQGIAAEFATKKYWGFSLYANTQYLEANFTNNIPRNGDFLPTIGKVKPLSPKWTNNVVLNYDSDILFSQLSYKQVSSQFSTFTNDQKMPGFNTLDFSVGAHLDSLFQVEELKEPIISLNFTNLTAGRYLGAIISPTANASSVVGTNGATIGGSQPGYLVAAPFAWTLSLSTGF